VHLAFKNACCSALHPLRNKSVEPFVPDLGGKARLEMLDQGIKARIP
jgi:hypothetical protein